MPRFLIGILSQSKMGFGFSIDPSPMIILGKGKVVDDYGVGNNLAFATTKKMYRAVTRGDTLLAWWPFDDDDLSSNLVTGKTDNQRTARFVLMVLLLLSWVNLDVVCLLISLTPRVE